MKKTFRNYHLFKILDNFNFQGIPLDVHLSHYFRSHPALGSKDRKWIAEMVYGMVRWMGLIDHFCEDTHSWEERHRIFAGVDLKEKIADSSIPLHIRSSFPKDLFQLLTNHYGEQKAHELCIISNQMAPTTVRVNILKTTRQQLLTKWQDSFSVSQTPQSVWGITFKERLNFQTLEEFKQGLFEVQDEASQLVANLVAPKPGDQVLDYCAGAGGKALAFAHKLQGKGQIYLHDIREPSLIEAKRRLKRAGIENAQTLSADAPYKEALKGKMDWVLVDAPCSGTGTLRRNPDMKWKFTLETLSRLVQEQRKIFKEALSFLSPKGKIVYATCSILPQENEQQLFHFQEAHGLNLAGAPFRSLPTEGGMDGFFAIAFSF